MDEFIEKYQTEICAYCKIHITDLIAWSKGGLCEGRFCEEATESYIETDVGSLKFLRFQRKQKLKKLKNVDSER